MTGPVSSPRRPGTKNARHRLIVDLLESRGIAKRYLRPPDASSSDAEVKSAGEFLRSLGL